MYKEAPGFRPGPRGSTSPNTGSDEFGSFSQKGKGCALSRRAVLWESVLSNITNTPFKLFGRSGVTRTVSHSSVGQSIRIIFA